MQTTAGRAKRTIKPPRRLYEEDGAYLLASLLIALPDSTAPRKQHQQLLPAMGGERNSVYTEFENMIQLLWVRVSSTCFPKHLREGGSQGVHLQ